MSLREQFAARRQRKATIKQRKAEVAVARQVRQDEQRALMEYKIRATFDLAAVGDLADSERDAFSAGWLAQMIDLRAGTMTTEGFEKAWKSYMVMRQMLRVIVDETKEVTPELADQFAIAWGIIEQCGDAFAALSSRFIERTQRTRFGATGDELAIFDKAGALFDQLLVLGGNSQLMRAAYLTADLINGRVNVPQAHVRTRALV